MGRPVHMLGYVYVDNITLEYNKQYDKAYHLYKTD